jgi:ribonuclease Y
MARRSLLSALFRSEREDAAGGVEVHLNGSSGGSGQATARAIEESLAELARREDWTLRQLETIEREKAELAQRRAELEDRSRELDERAARLESDRAELDREAERLAGMSREEAEKMLVDRVTESARRRAGLALKRIEEESKLEADRRARGVLAVAMQRLAGSQASETTSRIVQLPNDDMKGRIIGREGRNIRTLENLTGVDIIVDETPSSVVVSCFDGMRREIACRTLESLIADGRINPARCEEAYENAAARVHEEAIAAAEQALLSAHVGAVHPEIVRLLARLRYRTSYGQNVLDHLVECANLAAIMAAEIGADVELARRAALLHDLGKAVSHEVEGNHAEIGARLARRYGEPESVVHAIEAHHGEIEPTSVEAVLVQTADALSGARPGARGEALEEYVKRLKDLEEIALRQKGVAKVYAMKAGREIRVMVNSGEVDDGQASLLAHEVAAAIESELEYPGRIKVTVIRESRATTFAT